MGSILKRAFLVIVFAVVAGAGPLAWADHGHGGGGGHGHGGGFSGGGHGHAGGFSGGGHGHGGGFSGSCHGHSGGFSGGHGFSGGGHGHVSYGNFGGHGGSVNHWGGGGRYYSGYSGYHNHGWPYSYRGNYYRPYAYGYYAYPFLSGLFGLYGYGGYPSSYYYDYPSYYDSYPSDYYVNGDNDYYADVLPPREYVVGRPVADVAQVQFLLPDPQATLWVQGKEMVSSGNVRQFKSPPLDPSQQYTYTVRAEWQSNGKLFSDERKVKVQANALAVVDFTRPAQAGFDAGQPAMPDLPPPQPPSAD